MLYLTKLFYSKGKLFSLKYYVWYRELFLGYKLVIVVVNPDCCPRPHKLHGEGGETIESSSRHWTAHRGEYNLKILP